MKEKPYRFMVRLPTGMKNQLAEAAKHYRRSMNSEIVARLQQSFSGIPDDASERAIEPPLHQQLEQMFKRNLTEDEEQLIRTYRRLGTGKRDALLKLLH